MPPMKTKKRQPLIPNPDYGFSDLDEPVEAPVKMPHVMRRMMLDEPCQSSPIFPETTSQHCPHQFSSMKLTEPNMFIRFPYRPSIMTLLRQVRTKPTDSVARAFLAVDPPQVYAGFQNHWNFVNDIPVLTILGACNTILSPPVITRRSFEYATVTVMASTSQEQATVEFKLPLFQGLSKSSCRIVMETTAALDMDDQYVAYAVHAQNPKEPLAIVKLWNLSVFGCEKLHSHSVYEAPCAKVTDELHLFGLSGDRSTSFQIEFPSIENPMMKMLEELDLQAIGYRNKPFQRPALPPMKCGPANDRTERNLVTRMMPQKATYRSITNSNVVIVPKRTTTFKGRIDIKPSLYPPPLVHQPGHPYGTIKPVLFPAGFDTYRNMQEGNNRLLREIIQDIVDNDEDIQFDIAVNLFSQQIGLTRRCVKDNLNTPFADFYNANVKNRYNKKKVPYYIRTQPLNVRPMDWMHPTKHPAIAVRENKVKLVFQDVDDDNDDGKVDGSNDCPPPESMACAIDDEIRSPSAIDTEFWLGDRPTPAEQPSAEESVDTREPIEAPLDLSQRRKRPKLKLNPCFRPISRPVSRSMSRSESGSRSSSVVALEDAIKRDLKMMPSKTAILKYPNGLEISYADSPPSTPPILVHHEPVSIFPVVMSESQTGAENESEQLRQSAITKILEDNADFINEVRQKLRTIKNSHE